jgi:hypothetical protein
MVPKRAKDSNELTAILGERRLEKEDSFLREGIPGSFSPMDEVVSDRD